MRVKRVGSNKTVITLESVPEARRVLTSLILGRFTMIDREGLFSTEELNTIKNLIVELQESGLREL